MPRIECPYPGLAPFTEEDARFFFGRAGETERILELLGSTRLTLLCGESGVGKTSLLRAGVLARLQESGRGAVYFKDWRGDAIGSLRAAVATAVGEPAEEGPLSLAGYLGAVTRRHEVELVVVLDQLEEYFVYHGKEDPEAGSVAGQLLEAARRTDLPVRFLAAMRHNTLSRLGRFRHLVPNLEVGMLRLQALRDDAARDAIEKPVRMYDALKPEERRFGGVEIEPALVDKVIEQVRRGRVSMDESGHGRSADLEGCEAAFLQLVMTRVWSHEIETASRTLWARTLDELGGAATIVHGVLEEALDQLTAEEREACSLMFPYLVTPTGSKVACSVEELAEHARTSSESAEKLLLRLADDELRILAPAPPEEGDVPCFVIRYDALGPAILQWRRRYRRKMAVLSYEAEVARCRVQLEEERLRERQLRWLLAAVAVLLAVALGAALFAASKVREARRAAELAGGAGDAEIRQLRSAAEERDQARSESRRLGSELAAAVANEHRLRERVASYEKLFEDSQSTLRSLEPQGGAARRDLRQLEANLQAAIDEADRLREQLHEADSRYKEFQSLEDEPGEGSSGPPNLADLIQKLEEDRDRLEKELAEEKSLRAALADQAVGLARWNEIVGRTVGELRAYLVENNGGAFVELAQRRLDAFDGMALLLLAVESLGGEEAVDGVRSIDLKGEAYYPRLQQSVSVRFFLEPPDRLYLELGTVPEPIVLAVVDGHGRRRTSAGMQELTKPEERLVAVFRENPFSVLQRRGEPDFLVGSVLTQQVDGVTVAQVAFEARGGMFSLGVEPGSGEVKSLSFLRRDPAGRYDEVSQVYSSRDTVDGLEVAYSVVYAIGAEVVLELTVDSIRINEPLDDAPREALENLR